VEKDTAAHVESEMPQEEGVSISLDSRGLLATEDDHSFSSNGTPAQILLEKDEDVPLAAEDLHNNDNKVLSVLTQKGSNYTFRGLMRSLNLHQQSLSRALHRLETLGLVEKSTMGYRLSKGGSVFRAQSAANSKDRRDRNVQLLQTYIPIDVAGSEVAYALAGKWFKNLRWMGLIESELGDYTLQWVNDDHNLNSDSGASNSSFRVNLRIVSDYIIIETNAASDNEKVQAMVGSYAIYEQITKLFQNKIRGNSIHMLYFDDVNCNRNN